MNWADSPKESGTLLVVFGILLSVSLALALGIGSLFTTRSTPSIGAPESQTATPSPALQHTVTAAFATVTAQAQVPVKFYEDFSVARGSWTGTEENDFARLSVELSDGELVVRDEAKLANDGHLWILSDESDFYLAVDTEISSGSPLEISGLSFRAKSSADQFLFIITNEQTFSVIRLRDGRASTVAEGVDLAIRPKQMNHLAVVADGALLTFFVNDSFVAHLEDDGLLEGALGIAYGVSVPGSRAVFRFDNLEVRAASPKDIALRTATAVAPQTVTAAYATATAQATMPVRALDPFDSDLGWETGSWESKWAKSDLEIEDGRLVIDMDVKMPHWNQFWGANGTLSDLYFAVDTKIMSETPGDESGIVFRSQGSQDFYFFSVSNDGTYSIAKVVDNRWTRLVRARSSSIQPNEMNRLALNAQGDQLTFFINGVFVEHLKDDSFSKGAVGLTYYVHEPEMHVVVEYDNYELRALPSAGEIALTQTAVAVQPTLDAVKAKAVFFADDFDILRNQNGWYFGIYSDDKLTGERRIEDGVYRWKLKALKDFSWNGIAKMEALDDGLYELRVKVGKGGFGTHAGILYQFQDDNNYSLFSIGSDGTYSVLGRRDGSWDQHFRSMYSLAIRPYDWNTLQVLARDKHYDFWINDTYVGSVTEERSLSGRVGVWLEMDEGDETVVEFDELRTVRLPFSGTPSTTPTPTRAPIPTRTRTPAPTDVFTTIPGIVGMPPESALERLQQNGLRGKLIVHPADKCAGIVTRQLGAIGERVARNTIVEFVSCRGFIPTRTVTPS